MQNNKMERNSKLLIGGQWLQGSESFAVHSPFWGAKLADVSSADPGQLETAIDRASAAGKELRKVARFQLASGLRRIAEEIERRANLFATTIAEEAAKPIALARSEVQRAIATFAWAAGEAERFTGGVVPVDTQANGRGRSAYTI